MMKAAAILIVLVGFWAVNVQSRHTFNSGDTNSSSSRWWSNEDAIIRNLTATILSAPNSGFNSSLFEAVGNLSSSRWWSEGDSYIANVTAMFYAPHNTNFNSTTSVWQNANDLEPFNSSAVGNNSNSRWWREGNLEATIRNSTATFSIPHNFSFNSTGSDWQNNSNNFNSPATDWQNGHRQIGWNDTADGNNSNSRWWSENFNSTTTAWHNDHGLRWFNNSALGNNSNSRWWSDGEATSNTPRYRNFNFTRTVRYGIENPNRHAVDNNLNNTRWWGDEDAFIRNATATLHNPHIRNFNSTPAPWHGLESRRYNGVGNSSYNTR